MASIDLQNQAQTKFKQQNDLKQQQAANDAYNQKQLDNATASAIYGAGFFAAGTVTVGTLVAHGERIANGIFGRFVKTNVKLAGRAGLGMAKKAVSKISKINFKSLKRKSTTWLDFYLNMQIDMAINRVIAFGLPVSKATAETFGTNEFKQINHFFELINHTAFADSLAEEYDSVVREGGKTLWGGGKVIEGGGHVTIMKMMLVNILETTRATTTGDLLREIGPAVKAYWTAAFLECEGRIGGIGKLSEMEMGNNLGVPTIPCIGAVKNMFPMPAPVIPGMHALHKASKAAQSFANKGGAIIGGLAEAFIPEPPTITLNPCLFPGIWTPITVPSNSLMSPFLTSFILSATLHMLTVSGLLTAMCFYPAPSPAPLPGVLPWIGYFVPPASLSNPLGALATYTAAEYAAAAIGKAAESYHSIHQNIEEGKTITAWEVIAATQKTAADAIVNENFHQMHEKLKEEGADTESLHKSDVVGSPGDHLYKTFEKTGVIDGATYIHEVVEKYFKGAKDSRSISSVKEYKSIEKDMAQLSNPNIQMFKY